MTVPTYLFIIKTVLIYLCTVCPKDDLIKIGGINYFALLQIKLKIIIIIIIIIIKIIQILLSNCRFLCFTPVSSSTSLMNAALLMVAATANFLLKSSNAPLKSVLDILLAVFEL